MELLGYIWVIRTVSKDGDVEHGAINDLTMRVQLRDSLARQATGIEVYHREAQRYHTRMALQLSCGWKRAV